MSMDNPNDAARLAMLERKVDTYKDVVETYEGVLFTIASMPTNYGEQHTREMLILAVNGAKKVLGLDKANTDSQGALQ